MQYTRNILNINLEINTVDFKRFYSFYKTILHIPL